MKNIITAIVLIALTIQLHAQEKIETLSGNFIFTHEVGINATSFLKSFFTFNTITPATITNVPSFLIN